VNDLDPADDVSVELVEFPGRYPQFEDGPSACLLDRIPAQELGLDFEPGDEAGAVVLDVPVPRDLDGVVLVEIADPLSVAHGSIHAMSPSASDYAWFRGSELSGAYCLTYIEDVTPTEFLDRLDATPYTEQQGLRALASAYWDDPLGFRGPWPFIGATSVPGRGGPWTLAVETNGFVGSVTHYMGPASTGTRIFSHYENAKGGHHFNWWEDGDRRASFERPWQRHGNTPDDLVDAMTRVGFDLDPLGEDPGVPGKLALAEELTGVRITAELLSSATYVTGYLGRGPVLSGESSQPRRCRGLGRRLALLTPPSADTGRRGMSF
jgi:hypothetical protein